MTSVPCLAKMRALSGSADIVRSLSRKDDPMDGSSESLVPVWTLTTASGSRLPAFVDDRMTPERLAEMRTGLAAFAQTPVVTLEAHPLPKDFERSSGIRLDGLSPLARELSTLISDTAKSVPAASNVAAGGDVLYRMVVPAKVAGQVGKGLVRPMASKVAPGGLYSALTNSTGIAAQATFVPVEAAAAGAAGGSAATVAAGVGAAGALTVAAPLVLMAVAVGVSAYADHKRQEAIEHITELLEKLVSDGLASERRELEGCTGAIDKATAILLDQGHIGASLGLDSAVHAIDTAIASATRRASDWTRALDEFGDGAVTIEKLRDPFPGIDQPGGEFRTHLELAALTIALKRRVIVLQAVEHSQSDVANSFENFVRSLKTDEQKVDNLESNLSSVVVRLSTLELCTPRSFRKRLMTRGEVDTILRSNYLLRDLADGLVDRTVKSDVVIEMAKRRDGSILVLPPTAA